jgi:hypothetical protein
MTTANAKKKKACARARAQLLERGRMRRQQQQQQASVRSSGGWMTDPFQAARTATLRQTRLLLKSHPEAAHKNMKKDENQTTTTGGALPLHLACERRASHSKLDIVKAWYDAYPQAALETVLETTDKNSSTHGENGEPSDIGRGVTPFHKLLKRIMSQSCSEEQHDAGDGDGHDVNHDTIDLQVLRFLFEATATKPDRDAAFGRLPFHHICHCISVSGSKSSNADTQSQSVSTRSRTRNRNGDSNVTAQDTSGSTTHGEFILNPLPPYWSALMGLFRDMVRQHAHAALGYVDRQGYTPLMLLVKEVPKPFYDLQAKVEQHAAEWSEGEERNIMTHLATQIIADIRDHQEKNLSFFANTTLLAIPMFRELWVVEEEDVDALEHEHGHVEVDEGEGNDNANGDANMEEDNAVGDAPTRISTRSRSRREDTTVNQEQSTSTPTNTFKKGSRKMPQKEAELLHMAYEGALLSMHDADAMDADAIGDAASGSSPSPQQETEMDIMDAFQTAECCVNRRHLASIVGTFQCRLLSVIACAFHPHDLLRLLQHSMVRSHYRPNRLEETNEQTSLNSVLHYFLKSLQWKAQAASLQLQEAAQVQGVESESEAGSSSSRTMTRTRKMPRQLFSRVPISLDHKHETSTSTEESSSMDTTTSTPATGTLLFSPNSSCAESTLLTLEAFMNMTSHMVHTPNARGELPLHVALGIPSMKHDANENKPDNDSIMDDGSNSHYTTASIPKSLTTTAVMIERLVDNHPASCCERSKIKRMYPFMLAGLGLGLEKERQGSSGSQEEMNDDADTCSSSLSTTFYLLRRFVAERDLTIFK